MATMNRQDIGVLIRTRRHELGLTLREASERSGFNYATLAQVERGDSNTTVDRLASIATALDAELVVELRPRDVPAPPPAPVLPPDRAALLARLAKGLEHMPEEFISPLLALAKMWEGVPPKP